MALLPVVIFVAYVGEMAMVHVITAMIVGLVDIVIAIVGAIRIRLVMIKVVGSIETVIVIVGTIGRETTPVMIAVIIMITHQIVYADRGHWCCSDGRRGYLCFDRFHRCDFLAARWH